MSDGISYTCVPSSLPAHPCLVMHLEESVQDGMCLVGCVLMSVVVMFVCLF